MVDNKLISLLKIVEYGSYTKAARQLSLTQPAISQHVRQLENSFGVKIFERAGGKMRLTRQGEYLVAYAKRITVLTERLKELIENEENSASSYNVGITNSSEGHAIVEALAAYANGNPGLNLKLVTAAPERLFNMLREYEVDFAVVDSNVGPEFDSTRLDTDKLVLCVSPTHPLIKAKQVSLAQLKKEKLILRNANGSTSGLFTAALGKLGLNLSDFNVVMEIESIATVKDLIRHEYGVAVLALSACAKEVNKGELVALNIERLSSPHEINIVYPSDFKHEDLINGIINTYNSRKQN
ncbi:MAG: LysR family transcriptional regulator [Lachnospiraceae bacterium]|nr:LysR family transcriptional regulator [Lachnospiraceae bacterium]